MATRLYLRDLPWAGANNPPRLVETAANDAVAVGALTPRALLFEPGASQKAIAIATKATTARQTRIYATFVSEPLANAETFTYSNSGTFAISVADSETNLNVNHCVSLVAVFVFRPSTNEVVGRLHFSDSLSNVSEPSKASSVQVSYMSRTLRPINGGNNDVLSALPGDVIVCQIGSAFTQGMGTAYSASFYYDGAVENISENAEVSNHASFIEFSRNFAFLYLGAVDGSASGASSASGTLTDLPGQLPSGGALCSASASATGMGNSDAPLGRLACVSTVISAGLTTISGMKVTSSAGAGPGLFRVIGASGGNRVLLLGDDGYIYTSSDAGLTTSITPVYFGLSGGINSGAVLESGVFVGMGTAGRYRFAPPYDSAAFTYAAFASGWQGTWSSAWDGEFQCVLEWSSARAYFQYGTDGSTWSNSPENNTGLKCVLKLGTTYIGGSTSIRTWKVGNAGWTTVSPPSGYSGTWSAGTVLNGVAYLMDTTSRFIISSLDGTTWTYRGTAPAGMNKLLAVGTDFLVAVGNYLDMHVSRDGGATWKAYTDGYYTRDAITGGTIAVGGQINRKLIGFESFPPYPMVGNLFVGAFTSTPRLAPVGTYTPIFAPSSVAAVASASADLLAAKGTNLYTDGPLTVVTSAAANLTEGPTQWLGVAKARSRTGGIGPVFGAYPSSDNGDVQHYTVLPNGRWLCSKDFTLRYSDDEGRVWRDTGVVSGYYASVALNAAGTRAVLPGAYSALYSDDFGKTWRSGAGSSGTPTSRVVYGAGKFVRFVDLGKPSPGATAEGRAQYSTDGVNWTNGPIFTDSVVPSLRSGLIADAGENLWYDATLGKFIAIVRIFYIDYPGSMANALMLSSDGINWTVREDVTLLSYLGLDYLGCAVRNGVMTTGQHYSTDAGLTWSPCSGISNEGVNPDYVVLPTATGFAAFVCGRAANGPAGRPETRAFVSSDGQTWDSRPIGGLPVAPGFLRGMSVPISDRPGEHFVLVRPEYMDGLTPLEGMTMLTVESGPTLTATGKQAATLMGAMADAVRAYGNIRDRVTPQFQGALLAQSTAQPAALLNADPYRVLLRNTAQASAALTTKVILRGTAKARSVQPPRGLTLSENRYLPGQVARSPNGTVITATHRLDPTTRVWAPLSPPDGTNLPMRVCHDGTNFIAFIAAGAKTYTSADGKTWVAGTPVTLPSGADWANLTQLSLSGAEGKSVMTACIGNSFVAWTSVNGRTWTAGTRPTTIGGDMRLGPLGYRGGYYFAVYATISGSGFLCYSANGTSWSRSLFYPGALNLAEPVLSYSAGVISVGRRLSAEQNSTVFYSMDALMAGGTAGATYPNDYATALGIPSAYYIGDSQTEEPTFYVASSGTLSQVVDPHKIPYVGYAPYYNEPPAGIEFTGDFIVSDGYYFGRVVRTADGVEFGAVSRVGPDLLNITNALSASAQGVASASALFVSPRAMLEASATVSSAAAAALSVATPLVGALVVRASTSTPYLQSPIALRGAVAASSAALGTLTTSIRLSASVAASAASAASGLLVPKPLAGAALATAKATAALQVPAFFDAQAASASATQGALKTGILLSGASELVASVAGEITVRALFVGSGEGGCTASADLSTEILMGAEVAAQSAVLAETLLTDIMLSAAVTCEVLAEAELDTLVTLRGVARSLAVASGRMRRTIPRAIRLAATSVTAERADIVVRHQQARASIVAAPTDLIVPSGAKRADVVEPDPAVYVGSPPPDLYVT